MTMKHLVSDSSRSNARDARSGRASSLSSNKPPAQAGRRVSENAANAKGAPRAKTNLSE